MLKSKLSISSNFLSMNTSQKLQVSPVAFVPGLEGLGRNFGPIYHIRHLTVTKSSNNIDHEITKSSLPKELSV